METLPEIHDIVSPAAHPPAESYLWMYIVILGSLLFGIAIAIWIYRFAKNKIEGSEKEDPHEKILEQLESLKDSAGILPVSTIAQQCSEYVRSFLFSEYSSPALFQSKEEFLKSPPALKLESKRRELVANLLNDLWESEYSPSSTDEERSTQLIDKTTNYFRQLHPNHQIGLKERIPAAATSHATL